MGIRPGFQPPPLPAARSDAARIQVELELVTPVLGGGPVARELDLVDLIRVPTIRGHLRFWWRALDRRARSADELFADERALWGGVTAQKNSGGRSLVEVRVEVLAVAPDDGSRIEPYPRAGQPATPGAYALFPARGERGGPSASRRSPGSRFRVSVACPRAHELEVRRALCAWVLFGGYGSRTRRGLGSLTVTQDAKEWLPTEPTRAGIVGCLGRDVFDELSAVRATDRARFAGADLACGAATSDAMHAWTEALSWLNDFRQSPEAGAREHGADHRRPGRSHWPEADKVRQLVRGNWDHAPRHNEKPVWPRAGFGLPIVAQFQRKARDGGTCREPGNFQIRWQGQHGAGDRLASPLIVKALPLADGRFAPCALWLDRSFPLGGRVVVEVEGRRTRGSEADFDELVAPGDETRTFPPLVGGQDAPPGRRLRAAFMTWVREQRGANGP